MSSVVLLCMFGGIGTYHYVRANTPVQTPETKITSNFDMKNKVIEFFEANDASEMIPIIKCESHFRQFDKNGEPLRNKAGSSAIGVAQIMTSLHPDPKVLKRYNRKYNTNLTTDDFDVTTFEDNIGYALILYKTNGTRDWECSKHGA